MKILDLGCGLKKSPGAIGLDVWRGSDADVVADLSGPRLPFRDNVFEKVTLTHVIEHVWETVHLMEEIGRVSVDGAIVEGATPHFSSSGSYADPTHCHHFACRTFDYISFSDERPGYARRFLRLLYDPGEIRLRTEGPAKLRKLQVRLRFNRVFAWFGIERLANIFPEFYEAFFAGLIPAREILFQLKAVKKKASEDDESDINSCNEESSDPHS